MAENHREYLRETSENIPFFCATTDIWSKSNNSFIAVSVHYYDPKTLQPVSKFIACEPFPGRHTHDRVADKLNGIFDRLGILNKVYFVTTDGAGEYTAAFKKFGENYKSMNFFTEHQHDEESPSDDEDFENDEPDTYLRVQPEIDCDDSNQNDSDSDAESVLHS